MSLGHAASRCLLQMPQNPDIVQIPIYHWWGACFYGMMKNEPTFSTYDVLVDGGGTADSGRCSHYQPHACWSSSRGDLTQ